MTHWDTPEREGTSGAAPAMFRHQPWAALASQPRRVAGYGVLACTNGAIVRPKGLQGAPAG